MWGSSKPNRQSNNRRWAIIFAGALLCLLLATACAPRSRVASGGPGADAAQQFDRLADEFIAGYLAWRPQTAVGLGLHDYDGKLTDFSAASVRAEAARLKEFQSRLARLAKRGLGAQANYQARLLESAIRAELFKFEDAQTYSSNPMVYVEALDLNLYLKRSFAPLPDRVRSMIALENQAGAVFAAAKANLAQSLPRPFVETGIEVTEGSMEFLEKDLPEALRDLDEPLAAEFKAANQSALNAVRNYREWLQRERLPHADQQFALGREKFRKMLRGEMIEETPEELLAIGERELRRVQKEFAETARIIDPHKTPLEVFKAIQKDHPTEQSLLTDTRKNLEAIRQFIVRRRLLTLPSEVRPLVDETPPYARATSFASMDTPGPFEERATEAYYYVTPVEKDWTPQQKEEWLTAYNFYTTDVVSIHEVYPGHYLQFLWLKASKASRLEKIFSSYSFVEGWAHYAEQMMLDEGFGAEGTGPTQRVRQAKYRLAQLDEALLRLCRLCVSIRMHCQGMSLEQASRFFEQNCYYEPKPARQEAVRGTFDPGYLCYAVGKLQLLKLRRDCQAESGAAFSLQRFHDQLLQHGAPPIRLLREKLLNDPAQWQRTL